MIENIASCNRGFTRNCSPWGAGQASLAPGPSLGSCAHAAVGVLEDAFFQRSWSAGLGGAAFDTSAHVSLFSNGGMVVTLTPSVSKAASAPTLAGAVEWLRSSLGDQYSVSPQGNSVLTKVHSDKSTRLLTEIARVETIFGGRVASRPGPSPRSSNDRRWYVVEALRASSWGLGSLGFCRNVGNQRRAIAAGIGVLVDSASGRPGISANFGGWVPQANKRWRQFCDDTVVGLTKEGFRVEAKTPSLFSAGRWIAGLSGARALKQADLFDKLIAQWRGAVVR
jgi:hypothetical protein